ncbi:MAG: hypothetical protein WBF32_08300, partial [Candidatus Aminicenantaceae bacterium]
MDQENDGKGKKENSQLKNEVNTGRRDVLKALSSLPVLGAFFYGLTRKRSWDAERKKSLLDELGLEGELDTGRVKTSLTKPGALIRIGIIGYGGRGEHLVRGAGFAHQDFFQIQGNKATRDWRQREV